MDKELNDKRWKIFREVLKKEREHHCFTQKYLAKRLGIEQSYISKTEIGDRRLDIIELLAYCEAMGLTLTDFAFRLEGLLKHHGLLSPKSVEKYAKWVAVYKEIYKSIDT